MGILSPDQGRQLREVYLAARRQHKDPSPSAIAQRTEEVNSIREQVQKTLVAEGVSDKDAYLMTLRARSVGQDKTIKELYTAK